jgi:hypothetical protein
MTDSRRLVGRSDAGASNYTLQRTEKLPRKSRHFQLTKEVALFLDIDSLDRAASLRVGSPSLMPAQRPALARRADVTGLVPKNINRPANRSFWRRQGRSKTRV